jgi:hypothetical protein
MNTNISLSKSKMDRLEKLGVDITKASLIYLGKGQYNDSKNSEQLIKCGLGYYTFTMQDLLMLCYQFNQEQKSYQINWTFDKPIFIVNDRGDLVYADKYYINDKLEIVDKYSSNELLDMIYKTVVFYLENLRK